MFVKTDSRTLVGSSVVLTLLAISTSTPSLGQRPIPERDPVPFSAEQAERGRSEYRLSCAQCHGENLDDGPFAQPLTGSRFRDRWVGQTADRLYTQMRSTMPPDNIGQLPRQTYADLFAFILQSNGISPGEEALVPDAGTLTELVIPGTRSSRQASMRSVGPAGSIPQDVALPEWPSPPDPLDDFAPVTDELMADPPAESWLHWRGTDDAMGFSHLDQINQRNIDRLGVSWTLSLPPGPNESTPLVHDGVMFVHSYGDNIQALHAATGDELWHYSRDLPEDSRPTVKRNIAVYGDKVYAGTSDGNVVALDVRTGAVVFDVPVGDDPDSPASITGGPLVARGKVMQGVGGRIPGGGYLQAFDAETGERAWRFYVIPKPGEPGGDSWNGLPWEERSGGTIWTSGSYDNESGLIYIGPAPTYDTGPLLTPIGQPGFTNDALYTNSTVAIDPDTGEIVWHYQHYRNDQFDLDWSFERIIFDTEVDGVPRRALITANKGGFYDALDASSGQYLYSYDMGLQNLILGANRETGEKIIDFDLYPDPGPNKQTKLVCPHAGGGRSWIPASLNPNTKIMYVPAVETCMNLTPVPEGENSALSTGYQWHLRPRPDSDGRYGHLQAFNVETREMIWTERQRAPQSSGVLATAGGLVFAGALDRWLTAYDDTTGETLWQTRLNDVPNSAPISYEVDGRQYIAVVVGYGGAQVASFPSLTPEIDLPAAPSSSVWVFELR